MKIRNLLNHKQTLKDTENDQLYFSLYDITSIIRRSLNINALYNLFFASLFQFNDLVLCCNKIHPVGKLKVRQMMEISGMTVQDSDEDLGERNVFRIRSRQRVLDLAASNQEEKIEWIDAISNVIKDYEAKRGSVLKQHLEQEAQKESSEAGAIVKVGESAPVWVKDEDVTMCMLCAVRFSLLSRRHHCRACGRVRLLILNLFLMKFQQVLLWCSLFKLRATERSANFRCKRRFKMSIPTTQD